LLTREIAAPTADLEQQVLATATAEGVVVLDAEGALLRANPRAQSMLGWSDLDLGHAVVSLLARAPFTELDGVPQPASRWPGLRALTGETVRALDIGFHREGRATWLSTTAMPIQLPTGECTGAVVCMSDVTLLRTLEQHHEQMLRLISHDIRNPLTSVHLNAQLLDKVLTEKGLEKEQRLASVVIGAARRLDAMIQELVDSARVRSGQIRLELRPVSVERVIPEILARNASALDTSRVRLLLPGGPIVIAADPARLERVLTSLLVLALLNCPDNAEVTLCVTTSNEEARFVISIPGRGQIRDEAPPPPRVPFPQAKHDQNFGMGLFIARMLVERHGGRLWVEGSSGQETTLNFAVPVAGPRPSR
jgi:PAS domain S-box-containing protein